jgi:heme-degrading monooxygenase HmoA
MFARVTLAEIDPVRMSVSDAVERFKELVEPELRKQPGYEGVYVLTTPEGKAMVISLWSTEDVVESNVASGYYEAQLAKFATVFRSPPGREQYEVALAESPRAAVP